MMAMCPLMGFPKKHKSGFCLYIDMVPALSAHKTTDAHSNAAAVI